MTIFVRSNNNTDGLDGNVVPDMAGEVETVSYRYKAIIGRRLHARTLPNQRIEAKIGCNVLNRMTSLGMPVSVRVK
jgi:hypothetical protein